MEGGLWQAILADAGASKIPLTDDEFLSFAKSLPDGTMHKVLESATPMTKISHYQAMKNEKLLYDQILVPAGIWPLGDSAQRLNPIYGQVRLFSKSDSSFNYLLPTKSRTGYHSSSAKCTNFI